MKNYLSTVGLLAALTTTPASALVIDPNTTETFSFNQVQDVGPTNIQDGALFDLIAPGNPLLDIALFEDVGSLSPTFTATTSGPGDYLYEGSLAVRPVA